MQLTGPITSVVGVGPALGKRLENLSIFTVGDLLMHAPRRYEDWGQPDRIANLRIGQTAIIKVRLTALSSEPSPRRRMTVTKAQLTDDTGTLQAVWFNQPYLSRTFRVGEIYLFRGSIGFDIKAHLKLMSNPSYETEEKILAIYPETAGLSSKQLRHFVRTVLAQCQDYPELLPDLVRQQENFSTRQQAFIHLHQPKTLLEAGAARRQFAFEEFYQFSLALGRLRQEIKQAVSPVLQTGDDQLRAFSSGLPFSLTNGQRQAAWQIIQDVGQAKPMHRLLEGDVGTGKTVVAAFASFVAVKAGYRVLWMAPTEVLAQQHQRNLADLFAPFGLTVGLWTGSKKEAGHPVTVGTHALLYRSSDDDQPVGLVVIDEQHRFGVAQRASLHELLVHPSDAIPHFLSMTATPIPRTLALALYGDLDLSILRERPLGRLPIQTKVVSPNQREAIYQEARQLMRQGRQVFVVCPTIDSTMEGGLLDQKAAIEVARLLQTKIFPEFKVGLLHGRQKPALKDRIMQEFAAGRLNLLVATAVIEVGIDVPNAVMMIIESAQQFGLAQLHQLRGRVGRGHYQSWCYLLTDETSQEKERLKAMEETEDGLRLAQIDLELRGPGSILGTDQSGVLAMKFASLADLTLLGQAKAAADQALAAGIAKPDSYIQQGHQRLQ